MEWRELIEGEGRWERTPSNQPIDLRAHLIGDSAGRAQLAPITMRIRTLALVCGGGRGTAPLHHQIEGKRALANTRTPSANGYAVSDQTPTAASDQGSQNSVGSFAIDSGRALSQSLEGAAWSVVRAGYHAHGSREEGGGAAAPKAVGSWLRPMRSVHINTPAFTGSWVENWD